MAKLAVLSNINIDPLQNRLQKNGFSDLYFGGYNQWQSELLNPVSGLHAFSPEYIFIYLNLEEFPSDISDLFSSIEAFAEKNEKTSFLLSNMAYPPYSALTYSEKESLYAQQLNNALNDFALRNNNIFILDFNRIIHFYGYKNLFDDKFWYIGRIKFSNQGFIYLAQELKNEIACLQGKNKKALVVDLDNTLWGGVVGENGWQHIQLSQEGEGRIFLDFQKKLKQLRQTGVLLAICSKNNEADVRQVFEKNNSMQLSWDDFILHQINWEPKPDNLIRIAETLNLGLDSIVFLDDSPAEREFVRQSLPEILTLDFPADISTLNQWFVTEVIYPFFSKIKSTGEDKEKTDQYKRNLDREKIKKQLSYDEFIRQLDIKLPIFAPDVDSSFRITQLTQKTNQFNLSGNKYNDLEIKIMIESSNYKIFACEYEDKFGKEGIIGCAFVKLDGVKASIESFYLSCRVLGRKVEFSFLEYILNELCKTGIQTVDAIYNETPRNAAAKDFYNKSGFKPVENGLSGKYILTLTP